MSKLQDMDWGAVTPDLADSEKKLAIHVMNVSLESPENIDRVQKFLTARIRRFSSNLPSDWNQKIIIDDRGQDLHPELKFKLKKQISSQKSELIFYTENKSNGN